MRVLLVSDSPATRSACGALATALESAGAEVLLDAPLGLEALSCSDLLLGLDGVGLFINPLQVPPFLQRLRQAAALRGRTPVAVFSGPSTPLVGDDLAMDLLPRLGVDLLCLQGPRQQEELADLVRTCGQSPPPTALLGLWGLAPKLPAAAPGSRPRRLVFLEQAMLPPAPGARLRLLEVLERLCSSSPDWEVILQSDPLQDGLGHAGNHAGSAAVEDSEPSLAALLEQRPPLANLRLAPPSDWARSLDRAGVCATISSPLLWEALGRELPLLLLGDYGIRSDMQGPLLFGSGLMGRITSCENLEELLHLPSPNPGWLRELGWEIGPDAAALIQWLADRPAQATDLAEQR
ncbi:DUF6716 putative glycosyltransferase [Cyanobium sp. NS01]|uniref:DUF6716 putative glycosyltransferase n=1 Tax=Cyanobium sp. NS01 TaxID=261284 RepID=UPI00164479F1|nr:DUF6716 putative glycosyltransferase [Cyanobium sp. NS01]